MPLSIGKVRVDVSLCGAIPRPCPSSSTFLKESMPPTTPAPIKFRNSSFMTSSNENSGIPSFSHSCFSTVNGHKFPTPASRCKNTSSTVNSTDRALFSSTNSFDTLPPSDDHSSTKHSTHLLMLEPPRWAVPARGDSRLEPVCEALGSHTTIDLTKRACFRVGRSPGSDIQLLHNTSSRRHALIVHHPNGGCYVVDCGSSHGTYINGVRVRSNPTGSMVIPHRVKRGSLIRFGGPGAPTFVLKSFSVGFSAMVKDLESPLSDKSPRKTEYANLVNIREPQEGGILKKRSFDEGQAPEGKRQRCISPASNMLENGPIRLVSPDSPRNSKRVSFHDQPQAFYPVLVTPDMLSSDDEDGKL